MAFQKGNRRQSVFAPRAIHYLEGITAAATVTLPVPRFFRPFSPILATLPPRSPSGIQITAVRLLPPVTGSYAQGNRPRVQLTMSGTGTTDVLITQC